MSKMKKKETPVPGLLALEARWLGPLTAVLWALGAGCAAWVYFRSGHSPFFSLDLWIRVFPPVWEMPFSVLLGHSIRLFKLILFMVSCFGIGRALLLHVFKAHGLNPLETFAFSYGLGTGLAGILILILAALSLLIPPVVFGSAFLLVAASVYLNRDLMKRPPSSADPRGRRNTVSDGATPADAPLFTNAWDVPAACLAVFAFGLYGFYALAPETFYDSLVYHMAIPDLYKMAGRLVPTPTVLYSGIPMHAEMLYVWALFIDDEILARLMHWSMGVGLAAGMMGLAIRCRKPSAGWLTCAIFFSTPLVGFSIWKTAVEVASSYAIFLCVHAALLHLRGQPLEDSLSPAADAPTAKSPAWWVLSAVFAGLAMGIKYTNWPLLAILTACFLFLRLRLRDILLYNLVSAGLVLPWILKNLWLYGNPVFPYFHERIQPLAAFPVNWRGLQGDAWGRDWPAILSGGVKTILEVLLHPWFMTMRGSSDPDFLGPIFLMGLPGLFLLRGTNRESRILLWILFGLWLLWWPVTSMPRFFMPGLVLLSLWIAWSLEAFSWKPARFLSAFGLLLLAVNNLFWVGAIAYQLDMWPFLIQGRPKAEYLSRAHSIYPTPYYPAAEWLNAHAPENARVLVVGDARGYYLERPFMACSVWDTDPFISWLKASASAEELKVRLDKEGFTNLMVNMGELIRLKRDAGLSSSDLKVLEAFMRTHARKRFEDSSRDPRDFRWSLVYELVPVGQEPPDKEESPLVAWYRQQTKPEGAPGLRH